MLRGGMVGVMFPLVEKSRKVFAVYHNYFFDAAVPSISKLCYHYIRAREQLGRNQ